MKRNELPDTCFSVLPSTGQLIILKNGEKGYYPAEWDTGNRAENRTIATDHNLKCGISDIQETAMLTGSMFGWTVPGAAPQWYLDQARYVNSSIAKGHIKDPVTSIYYPINDFLLRYEIVGKQYLYLPLSTLPKELMGARSQYIMQPDLVQGLPFMLVRVSYMLLIRLGYPADEYFSLEEFSHVYEFNTPQVINALGIATSDIAEMGLREISRTVIQVQREQFFANREKSGYDKAVIENDPQNERSGEYGTHIPEAERLSGAEPDDAPDSGSPSGQVRRTAEGLSEETQAGAVYQPENHRQADGASGGDRAGRPEAGGAERDTDGESRGRDGGTESHRSPSLDGSDEQLQTLGRGSGAERSDLQLTPQEPEPTANGDWLAEGVPVVQLNQDKPTTAGSSELPAVSDEHGHTEPGSPRYQVAVYYHIENGFNDKLDYQMISSAFLHPKIVRKRTPAPAFEKNLRQVGTCNSEGR